MQTCGEVVKYVIGGLAPDAGPGFSTTNPANQLNRTLAAERIGRRCWPFRSDEPVALEQR